jgi:hypothetical protein
VFEFQLNNKGKFVNVFLPTISGVYYKKRNVKKNIPKEFLWGWQHMAWRKLDRDGIVWKTP